MNESNIAFYDAMQAKFATSKIYCPTPEDLGHKLRAMKQWEYSWQSSADRIEIKLDLSRVLLDTVPHFTGGMGIRIENTRARLEQVMINGQPHAAFSDQVIILPNLQKGINTIHAALRKNVSEQPRLTYVSKRMPAIYADGDSLVVHIQTKAKAKFDFFVSRPFVLLHADAQEWNRNGDDLVQGFVASDRRLVLKPSRFNDFVISRASLPITDFKEGASTLTLSLHKSAGENSLWFRCAKPPQRLTFKNQPLSFQKTGKDYRVTLPNFVEQAELTIAF
ncbi:MAG: hypothetical protein ACREOO_05550 [bacterium]